MSQPRPIMSQPHPITSQKRHGWNCVQEPICDVCDVCDIISGGLSGCTSDDQEKSPSDIPKSKDPDSLRDETITAPDVPAEATTTGAPGTTTGSQTETCELDWKHDKSRCPGKGWLWLRDKTLPGGGEWVQESEFVEVRRFD
jgi:hypothetical protein